MCGTEPFSAGPPRPRGTALPVTWCFVTHLPFRLVGENVLATMLSPSTLWDPPLKLVPCVAATRHPGPGGRAHTSPFTARCDS